MFDQDFFSERMPLQLHEYVPALRWRQAEYQALHLLSDTVKDLIVPLITIPPIEFDFESGVHRKSIQQHVERFPSRYKQKWTTRAAWITADKTLLSGHMETGEHVLTYVFNGVRGTLAIPALPLGASVNARTAVKKAVATDHHGLGIVVRLEDLMGGTAQSQVDALMSEMGVMMPEVDILLDMNGPNYEPYQDFGKAFSFALDHFGNTSMFRNFVLVGTAMPDSLAHVPMGSTEIVRHDWRFYQTLMQQLPPTTRRPIFGDHTIVHPGFTATNPRMLNPSAKLIYTTSDVWAIRKGSSFRAEPGQMQGHCERVVADPAFEFRGHGFSQGDTYIARCAAGVEGPGNLTRWKEVGINHHITTVVAQLA